MHTWLCKRVWWWTHLAWGAEGLSTGGLKMKRKDHRGNCKTSRHPTTPPHPRSYNLRFSLASNRARLCALLLHSHVCIWAYVFVGLCVVLFVSCVWVCVVWYNVHVCIGEPVCMCVSVCMRMCLCVCVFYMSCECVCVWYMLHACVWVCYFCGGVCVCVFACVFLYVWCDVHVCVGVYMCVSICLCVCCICYVSMCGLVCVFLWVVVWCGGMVVWGVCICVCVYLCVFLSVRYVFFCVYSVMLVVCLCVCVCVCVCV